MIFAASYWTIDPIWPWSLPRIGPWSLLAAVAFLAALTIWTYSSHKEISWKRLIVILLLRLGALAVAVLLQLRPSLATEEESVSQPSRAIILLDLSKSMNINDEFNNLSRIDTVRRLLHSPPVKEQFKKLGQVDKVEFVVYQGAEDLKSYNPEAAAEGKQTRIGLWLNEILKRHGADPNVLGVLLFSDGVETNSPFSAQEEAKRFAGKKWPIYAFATGQPTTSLRERDLIADKITIDPPIAYAKTKMTVTAQIHATDYAGESAWVRVWIEDPKTKSMKPITHFENLKAVNGKVRVALPRARDNRIQLECLAPEIPGEYKLMVKVDPLSGETNVGNNEAVTYFDVTKEGVSILWVEGRKRAFEPIFAIRQVLSKEKRFRVYYVEKTGKNGPDLELDKRHYDVIIIGDISAEQFSGGNPEVMNKVRDMVTNQGTGLIMLGGYDTFGNKDWHQPLSLMGDFFPVRFDKKGQIDEKTTVEPTPEGLEYLLKLDENPIKNEELWKKHLQPLEGMSLPGERDPRAVVYARRQGTGEAVLAGIDRGQGRIMTFAGDTTWQAWRRSPEAVRGYEVFWRKLVLWLAKQEKTESNLQIALDGRRLELGKKDRLDFTVKLRGAGGVDIKKVQYTAKVVGPQGEYPVSIPSDQERGFVGKPPGPGEYRLEVSATGKDAEGRTIQGSGSTRFLAEEQDLEALKPAADHEFLEQLARHSEGRFSLAEERKLLQLLEELGRPTGKGAARVTTWPDWRHSPVSSQVGDQLSALWHSWGLACFLAFSTFLCLEWYLRRRWGLV